MTESGLIKRRNGRYYLTSFGQVIYSCTMIAKNALNNYLNFKVIEAIKDSDFPYEEFSKLVDALIDSREVKQFLIRID
jgi:hypothetical protein